MPRFLLNNIVHYLTILLVLNSSIPPARSSSSLAAVEPKLYPNPSSDFFNVELEESGVLQVFDVNGKLVTHNDLDKSAKVDVSTWASGMYHVSIKSNEHCFHTYFLKN